MSCRPALLRGAFVFLLALLPCGAGGAEIASAKTCVSPEAAAADRIPWETPEIFAVIRLRDAAPGTRMKVVWISVDAIEPPNFIIQADEQKVPPPGGTWKCTFSAPKDDWPAGRYRVDLFLDGRKVRSLPFSILKANASGGTAGSSVAHYDPGALNAGRRNEDPPASGATARGARPSPPPARPTVNAAPSPAPPAVTKEPGPPSEGTAALDLSDLLPSDGSASATSLPEGSPLSGTFCTQSAVTPQGLALVQWAEFDGAGRFSFGATLLSGYGEIAGGGVQGGGRFRQQGQLLLFEFVDGSQGVGAVLARDEAGNVEAFQYGQLIYAADACL